MSALARPWALLGSAPACRGQRARAIDCQYALVRARAGIRSPGWHRRQLNRRDVASYRDIANCNDVASCFDIATSLTSMIVTSLAAASCRDIACNIISARDVASCRVIANCHALPAVWLLKFLVISQDTASSRDIATRIIAVTLPVPVSSPIHLLCHRKQPS